MAASRDRLASRFSSSSKHKLGLRQRLGAIKIRKIFVVLVPATISVFSALLATSLVGLLWPKPVRLRPAISIDTPTSLAVKPARPITVLIIGVDADDLKISSNNADPWQLKITVEKLQQKPSASH